jgi:aryl-alcohol dehydrogenase-like predicted oxidoreductase
MSNGLRWLEASELRIGLGCMRLPADGDVAADTIAAAAAAGITIFDTAHAYGSDDLSSGQNERLLARSLRSCDADRRARIVTKGGMTRAGTAWIPDGRAKSIRADCEASLDALDGMAIDLYLLHAPDQRTTWLTSVRALARLLDEHLVAHVGLSNITRRQLEEAVDFVDVTAIEVALSALDDTAVRSGLVEFCDERGIAVIAQSPLGGPRRARALARRADLVDIARARGATPEEIALAWLLDLSRVVVAIPGATRPETARSAAHAATLHLTGDDRTVLGAVFGWRPRPVAANAPAVDADVLLVMGVPGAGKSRHAEEFVARGYARLNRDERGGSLRHLGDALGEALASGERRIVLDNTYLTRAARSHLIEQAARHGVAVRCVWIDTPLAQAQVNLVQRLLDRFGALPGPEQMQALARTEPGLLTPTRHMRAFRELEPPSTAEGFASVERIPFERMPHTTHAQATAAPAAVFVAAAALTHAGWEDAIASGAPDAPHLLFDWRPGAAADALDAEVSGLGAATSGPVTGALCAHQGGAPVCWCRPPLPGLLLAFARQYDVDVARTILIGTSAAHRTLATTLGAQYRTG